MSDFVGAVVRVSLPEGHFEGTVVSVDARSRKLTLEHGQFLSIDLVSTITCIVRSEKLCHRTDAVRLAEVLWARAKSRYVQ